MPVIFDYTDYRKYLRDYYEECKRTDPKYSHRYFAMKAGIKSTGFFSDVMTGKRNLTTALILKFRAALKLKKDEADYFQNMVGYSQARTVEERTYYYEKMLPKVTIDIRRLERDKFEFYGTWYYSAIRELLCYFAFTDDYDALARTLDPPISANEARRAIELLSRLGLIKKDSKGRWRQSEPLITSGGEFRSLHIANFQRATMTLACEALDRFPGSVRDSSTLTMTLSSETFERAKQEIAALRKRLLALAEQDQKVDRVYQFNVQLFPLTKMK